MDIPLTTPFDILAEAFCYPEPGRLQALEAGQDALPAGPVRKAFSAFIDQVQRLDQGEWEELHTRSLDLNPPAAPYVGFQTWGESYQRGTFLSKMNRELMEADVDPGGELPDHLIPVLRYLGGSVDPLPELMDVLEPAIRRMLTVLREVEPANPYGNLLEAVHEMCKDLKKEEA